MKPNPSHFTPDSCPVPAKAVTVQVRIKLQPYQRAALRRLHGMTGHATPAECRAYLHALCEADTERWADRSIRKEGYRPRSAL